MEERRDDSSSFSRLPWQADQCQWEIQQSDLPRWREVPEDADRRMHRRSSPATCHSRDREDSYRPPLPRRLPIGTRRPHGDSCRERIPGESRGREGPDMADEHRDSCGARRRPRRPEEEERGDSRPRRSSRRRKGEEKEGRCRWRQLEWKEKEKEEEEEKEGERLEEQFRGCRRGQGEEEVSRKARTTVFRTEGSQGGFRDDRTRPAPKGPKEAGVSSQETYQEGTRTKQQFEQRRQLREYPKLPRSFGHPRRCEPHQTDSEARARTSHLFSSGAHEGVDDGLGRSLGRRSQCSSRIGPAVRSHSAMPEAERRSPEGGFDAGWFAGLDPTRACRRGMRYDDSAPKELGTSELGRQLVSGGEIGVDTSGYSNYEITGRAGGSEEGDEARHAGKGRRTESESRRLQRAKQGQERPARGQRKGKEERRRFCDPEELEDERKEKSRKKEISRSEADQKRQRLGREETKDDEDAFKRKEEDAYMTAEVEEGASCLPSRTGPKWPRVEGTAIPGSLNFQTVRPSAEKRCEELFSVKGGFGEVVTWLEARVGDFLGRHCKTKPAGRIFPLPSSTPTLRVVFPQVSSLCLAWIRRVCLSLNSLNGETLEGGPKVSPYQMKILSFWHENVIRVLESKIEMEPMIWKNFLKVKTIDYKGEEVQTAQSIEWENIAPALPQEVGRVPLEEVVELGCKHYVLNFKEYLLPEQDQVLVSKPKVMVPSESWLGLCKGLIDLGLCRVLPESQVYRVKGELLLNGLFGVSKGEFINGYEVMRLIMNLIPLNAICQGLEGDVSTLPSWSGMTGFHLMPTENLVISSEDVRCFFYIFRVPEEWHPFLCFNRPVPGVLCGSSREKCYLSATVLPMGFKNSVGIAQHVHRHIVQSAFQRSGVPLHGENELRKDRPMTHQKTLFRIYLDNFDELRKVNKELAEVLEGTPSVAVLGLREEYLRLGVPRHPKKSAEQLQKAEVQGALVDGKLGVAYPKPEKVLKYSQLAILLLEAGECTQKQAQIVGGGFVYVAMFRRPLLGNLNALWTFITSFDGLPPFIRKPIPPDVSEELVRMVAMSPLAVMNFRSRISEHVTASDASEFGGGVTVSKGLTPAGSVAANCSVRGDVLEPLDGVSVVSIGLFDGIGALRVAVDALGWHVLGHISVECNPEASRVVESRFPHCTFVAQIEEVDESKVKAWSTTFSQAGLVVIGAGPPCQGVSKLNADRKGALKDHRSSLFWHVPRIRDLVKKYFPWAQVRTVMESVASMDEKDRNVMSQGIGMNPWKVDAGQMSLAHRPRLYWLDWELLGESGVEFRRRDGKVGSVVNEIIVNKVIKLEDKVYLLPGCKRQNPEPLPTFTTSRPRGHPGRHPAGLSDCQEHEVQRWQEDSHRYPPYQYKDKHLIANRKGELRLPSIEERETILGFPRGYTVHCLAKKYQGSVEHNDTRATLLGNSWNVTVVAWLLQHLGYTLGVNHKMDVQEVISRTAPGCSKDLQTFLQRPSMQVKLQSSKSSSAGVLVQKLTSLVSLKGEDLLLQAASEDVVKYHRLRASIPANLWKWRTAAAWKWKGGKEHINVLEMRAVLCALRWRLEKQHHIAIKLVHLVDSQVCLHALSRGRSSSRKLRRTLSRINSLLLATGSQVLWTYVHTKQNPADAPSRHAGKRKWSHG